MTQKTVLILLHGMRTDAEWQEKVASRFAQNPDVEVIPIKYGRFDPFRFWSPLLTRRAKIEEINTKIQNALSKYPNYRKVIIAHSFGTYALACVMKSNPLVRFDRIILCGSVVPSNFSWDDLQDQMNVRPGEHLRDYITNECGARDIWPILAQSTTFGFGATGAFGFGVAEVRDRYHNKPHSGYFEDAFIEEFWMPLIQRDKWQSSVWERDRPKTPIFHQMLRLPYKFILPLLLGTILYAGGKAGYDYLYDYSGMFEAWQECNAHLVYPTRVYDLVASDRNPSRHMLIHKNGLAKIYINAWKETEGLDVASILNLIRMQPNRDISYDPRSSDVISGKFTDNDGKRKEFYYRFRSAPTMDHTGRIVKMFEHVTPEVSPDQQMYWNVNHIISGSFFNYGGSNAVNASCMWQPLATIRSAKNSKAVPN